MATSATLEKSSNLVPSSETADLAQITAILMRALGDKSYAVYLFGSRASGTAHSASDFDVAVLADEDISHELSFARELLEESNIPFKVDVVDLRLVTPALRYAVQSQGILLWKN